MLLVVDTRLDAGVTISPPTLKEDLPYEELPDLSHAKAHNYFTNCTVQNITSSIQLTHGKLSDMYVIAFTKSNISNI